MVQKFTTRKLIDEVEFRPDLIMFGLDMSGLVVFSDVVALF